MLAMSAVLSTFLSYLSLLPLFHAVYILQSGKWAAHYDANLSAQGCKQFSAQSHATGSFATDMYIAHTMVVYTIVKYWTSHVWLACPPCLNHPLVKTIEGFGACSARSQTENVFNVRAANDQMQHAQILLGCGSDGSFALTIPHSDQTFTVKI